MVRLFGRYAAASIIGSLCNVGVFALLLYLGQWYVLASVGAFSARSIVRFLGLRFWVFKGGQRKGFLIKFLLTEFVGLCAGTVLLILFVEGMAIPRVPALLLVIAILSGGMFLAHRRVLAQAI